MSKVEASSRAPLATVVLCLAASWLALPAMFPPDLQRFPLNDDAAFSRTVFALARGEGLHYLQWPSMPLLGQLAWALPWVWLGGASPVVLRVSTQALGLLGIVAFYDLLRHEASLSPRRAAIASLCLGWNPLFFLLACTFHTDVPALSFSLVALSFYSRGLRERRLGWWLAGAAAAMFAVGTRQNAIVVPVVAGILLWRRGSLRELAWLAGSAVPAVAAVAIHFWFYRRPDVLAVAPHLTTPMVTLNLGFAALHLLGLSALPLLVLRGSWSRRAFPIALVLMFVAVWLRRRRLPPDGGLFPYVGDWMTEWGQFYEGLVLVGRRPVQMGHGLRAALTVVGCVAGAALVARIASYLRTRTFPGPLQLFSLLHVPFLLIVPMFFDRYLLILFPGALAIAGAKGLSAAPDREGLPRALSRLAPAALLALVGAASVASMHDLFSWSSAWWTLGRRAIAAGVDPTTIEGGLSWDGWYTTATAHKVPRPPEGLALPFTRQSFPDVTGRQALSFSVLPGTRALDAEPYTLWLIPGAHQIVRIEPAEARAE